jgi:PAS domain S-box-containing protein
MTWNYIYTPQIWSPVLMAVLMTTLSVYSGRRRSVPGAISLMVASLLAAAWATGSLLEYAAVDMATKITWFKVQAATQVPITIAITCFILEYARPGRWLTRSNLALLAFPGLLTVVLILTDDLHHLIWTKFSLVDGSIKPQLGPGSWFLLAYSFGVLEIVNLVVFGWLFWRSPQHRWPVVLMLVGQFAGRMIFLLDRAHLVQSHLPLDLFGVSLEFLMYAIVLFGFRILDPIPLARRTAIQQLQTGMLVLNPQGRVVSLNPAAQAILGKSEKHPVNHSIQELLPAGAGLLENLQSAGTGQGEISLGAGTDARKYQVDISPLKDWRGLGVGRLLLIHDVTEQKRAQAQILEQQRALATLKERERLARELHDSLGQALAATHLQASTAKLLFARGEAAQMSECLDILADTTLQAEADMREYLLGIQTVISVDHPFFAALRGFLERYTRQYNLPVELSVPPELEEQGVPQTAAIQLLRIIQEALSNVRKHARATSARLAFTVTGNLLQIAICDNGQGFEPSATAAEQAGGYGLRSMRERAEELGGCLGVISHPGQGTQVIVKVPVTRER